MQAPINSVRPGATQRPPRPTEPDPVSPIEILKFIVTSARRHVALGVTVAVIAGSLGVAGVFAVPALYQSTSKIFMAGINMTTVALANARRPEEYLAPQKGLQEAVLNDSNILALVREARLAATWDRTRNTWALQWKDAIARSMTGPVPPAATERVLVEMLKSSISVSDDNGSIRFTVDWRDPKDAYNLVRLAMRNFMAGRGRDQFAAIERAIGLIEAQLATADAAIPPVLKEMQDVVARVREASGSNKPPPATPSPNRPAVARPAAAPQVLVDGQPASPELLQETRRAAREVAEPWQKRLADLQFQMAELRTVFGPEHPNVRQQEAKIAAASETPMELVRLRDREASIVSALSSVPGAPAMASGIARPQGQSGGMTFTIERSEDPEVAAARARVEAVLSKSRELSNRLDATRLELATAQAIEKYRYTVIEAPEIPKKPIKPKRPMMIATAIAVALLLGFLAGAVRELGQGKVLEPWQVRMLGIEVLGEVRLEGIRERRLRSRG